MLCSATIIDDPLASVSNQGANVQGRMEAERVVGIAPLLHSRGALARGQGCALPSPEKNLEQQQQQSDGPSARASFPLKP